ncbi:MAG: relaxase domain-containing protein [Planctomycetes bacterium]|nr:relaxase domain-containing protein [Planctomycetota bacterium]
MLRIIQNSMAEGAKRYYSTADYYSEGQELTGIWRGKGAAMLGLSGEIEKRDWDALCDNRDPATGETLTLRQRANRRVGYDFNWHVPKSVSLLYGITNDERILQAFRDAVHETMQDIEAEMQARVRTGGQNCDQTTGNMIWGEYVHRTARPVDGVPDPHLHAHCFVLNATYAEQEGRWKAGQFAGLKQSAPYYEALFHARLSHRLGELGLPTVRTRTGWELDGMGASLLERFSRRTGEIEALAAEQGITDPRDKGEIGARSRKGKAKQFSAAQLREIWRDRLSPEEGRLLGALAGSVGGDARHAEPVVAQDAVRHALDHCFERQSVVPERTVLTAAIKRGYGSLLPQQVSAALSEQPLLRAQRGGRECVTTKEVLAEERSIVAFAREGRGTRSALAPGEHAFERQWLSDEQKRAVQQILSSRDNVQLLRGRAGTGKTSMMLETVEAIEAAGSKVFTFAPSAEASRGVLRGEGFGAADTVARLLLDERMQKEVRGNVIWVDEAGLLGVRTMHQLFELAGRLDARVVLAGDVAQHGSVERGSALRLIEDESGIVPAQIKEIRRQKGAYKAAVEALSEGDVATGLARLDALGWVREVGHSDRYLALAADYVGAVAAGDSALCVSPTHLEAEWVTQAIRAELKAMGRLGEDERVIPVLRPVNLTEAERSDPANFEAADVLVFHQNAKGITKGERLEFGKGDFPGKEAAKFQLFRRDELVLAPGDMVRITRNGKTADGKHRLNNGALYAVRGFDGDGNLELANGWTVGRDYGHLAQGYCVTSYASQGKTVAKVFIGLSAPSYPATSREGAYVAASRGRQQAVFYTDSKAELLEAASRSDDRVSATQMQRELMRAWDAQRSRKPERKQEQEQERLYG